MASPPPAEEAAVQEPDGFFESIGAKAEGLAPAPAPAPAADEERKPVEEIESLCMNCGENVSARRDGALDALAG